jgi:hypothetical protein
LPQLKLDSSISKSQVTVFLGFKFHYRLDIIFDLKSVYRSVIWLVQQYSILLAIIVIYCKLLAILTIFSKHFVVKVSMSFVIS